MINNKIKNQIKFRVTIFRTQTEAKPSNEDCCASLVSDECWQNVQLSAAVIAAADIIHYSVSGKKVNQCIHFITAANNVGF